MDGQLLLVQQGLDQLVSGWVTQVKLLGAAIGCIQVYYICGSMFDELM